ncbi:MAG TPA: SLC13 family permease, partial [Bacteroidales bacterium]|nr:SLC13 family permease [Bacteroidales bacterium]
MTAFKKKKTPSLKFIVGLALALTGFFLPFLIRFEGLPVAGHFALSIFLLAAILWIFETIPIYATSLLVIFLQVVLLSAQGPLFSKGELQVTQPVWVEGLWKVPEQALDQDSLHIKTGDRSYLTIPVEIVQEGEYSLVWSDYLNNNSPVVSNSQSRFIGYLPVPFTLFIGTLANPVIILFLAGFMLAAGAVKFNLDKNITGFLLTPFGHKPANISLGLMLVTASLSAFMSNTATTAMMMTVAIPIIMQVNPLDKFRMILVLSVPIAANLGGLITPIGTPPNAIVISALQQQGIQIDFGKWVSIMLPLASLMLLISWTALQMLFKPSIKKFSLSLEKKLDKSPKAIFL